jgi:hypothetical protein
MPDCPPPLRCGRRMPCIRVRRRGGLWEGVLGDSSRCAPHFGVIGQDVLLPAMDSARADLERSINAVDSPTWLLRHSGVCQTGQLAALTRDRRRIRSQRHARDVSGGADGIRGGWMDMRISDPCAIRAVVGPGQLPDPCARPGGTVGCPASQRWLVKSGSPALTEWRRFSTTFVRRIESALHAPPGKHSCEVIPDQYGTGPGRHSPVHRSGRGRRLRTMPS